MTNEQERPAKPERSGMTVTGIVFFWMGIAMILVSLLLCVLTGGGSWPEDFITGFFILVIGASAGLIFALVGAILYFIGRNQAKRQNLQ
jgi:cation transport ATPase